LLRLSLALGGDPTKEIIEGKTVFDYIGKDWSEIGMHFYLALPDWPTENDDEIRQLQQAHINSH